MYKFVFGPVPSRRLGRSIGVSPIPKGYCNYACVYCQLGRTTHLTNERALYFPCGDILEELRAYLKEELSYDVITIVGEGEPTLYSGLGKLIAGIQSLTDKPVAVLTNGALLYDPAVREALMGADIVMPSIDAGTAAGYKQINRPHGTLRYNDVLQGLIQFSKAYTGALWLETMLIRGINDDQASVEALQEVLREVQYKRLYINTPVRPPAEAYVKEPDEDVVQRAAAVLGGTSINQMMVGDFHSEIADDYEAVLSIIGRHPMNQHEIQGFLTSRQCKDPRAIFRRLKQDKGVSAMRYKSYVTYRLQL